MVVVVVRDGRMLDGLLDGMGGTRRSEVMIGGSAMVLDLSSELLSLLLALVMGVFGLGRGDGVYFLRYLLAFLIICSQRNAIKMR